MTENSNKNKFFQLHNLSGLNHKYLATLIKGKLFTSLILTGFLIATTTLAIHFIGSNQDIRQQASGGCNQYQFAQSCVSVNGCSWDAKSCSDFGSSNCSSQSGCDWVDHTAPCYTGNCTHEGCDQRNESYDCRCREKTKQITEYCSTTKCLVNKGCQEGGNYCSGTYTSGGSCSGGYTCSGMGTKSACETYGCSWIPTTHYCSSLGKTSCKDQSGCTWNPHTCTGSYQSTVPDGTTCDTCYKDVCYGGVYKTSGGDCTGDYVGSSGDCTGTPIIPTLEPSNTPVPTPEPTVAPQPTPPPGICEYNEWACSTYTQCVHCEKTGPGNYDWEYVETNGSNINCPEPCGTSGQITPTPPQPTTTPPASCIFPASSCPAGQVKLNNCTNCPDPVTSCCVTATATPQPTASPQPTLTPTQKPSPTPSPISQIVSIDGVPLRQAEKQDYYCYYNDCIYKTLYGSIYISNDTNNWTQAKNCPLPCRPNPPPTVAPTQKPNNSETTTNQHISRTTVSGQNYPRQQNSSTCTLVSLIPTIGGSEAGWIQDYDQWLHENNKNNAALPGYDGSQPLDIKQFAEYLAILNIEVVVSPPTTMDTVINDLIKGDVIRTQFKAIGAGDVSGGHSVMFDHYNPNTNEITIWDPFTGMQTIAAPTEKNEYYQITSDREMRITIAQSPVRVEN